MTYEKLGELIRKETQDFFQEVKEKFGPEKSDDLAILIGAVITEVSALKVELHLLREELWKEEMEKKN